MQVLRNPSFQAEVDSLDKGVGVLIPESWAPQNQEFEPQESTPTWSPVITSSVFSVSQRRARRNVERESREVLQI